MNGLFIADTNPLKEALSATFAAAGVTVQPLGDLKQLQAVLSEPSIEALWVALPLPDQIMLLLPQLLCKLAPQLPVTLVGMAPPLEGWATYSVYPYIQIPADSPGALIAQLQKPRRSPPLPYNTCKRLLQAITSLPTTLFTESDLEPLLQHIIEEAVALIPEAEAGSLLLDEGGQLAFRAFVGYVPELRQVKIPPTSSFVPRLRAGEIVHVHDIILATTDDFPAEATESLRRYGRLEEIHETLAAPLLHADAMIGYITVDSFEPGTRFTHEDEEALGYLANIATIAIHNAQLLDAERATRTLAETIGELGQQLVASLDMNEVLAQVLDALFHLTPCDAAEVLLVRDDQAVLAQQRTAGNLPYPPINSSLDIQHTANLRQAAQQGTPLLSADVIKTPGWISMPETTWIRSHIAAPFYLNQQLAGFLCVSGARPQQFSQSDCDTLAALLPLVTIALHNARLFEEALVARQRAEAAYENLRRLDAMKSQFIQNVSHELRTPLAIVKGYLDLVLDTSFGFRLEPAMEQALKAMQTHTDRLAGLVESITTLEDVETGQLERHPQPIQPVFLRAVQAIRQKVARQQLELQVDLNPSLPEVNLDPQQLGLALWHLLDNAIKFNRPGGHIWMKAWMEDNEVLCSIRDDGIGIPRSEQTRIFERFYQIDGSTKRRYEGMGLGLSIVREVIEKHGGRVWVDSEGPDSGATFTIALPAYHEEVTS